STAREQTLSTTLETAPVPGPPAAGAPSARPRGRGRTVAALGFSQAVDNSESGLINTFFPLIRTAFGLDYGALGMLTAIPRFSRMVFGPFWAMMADRFGRKPILFLVTGVW